jgi:hypothetical protein
MKNLLAILIFLTSLYVEAQTSTESKIKEISGQRIKALIESDFNTLESIYDQNSISIHSNGMIKTTDEHLQDVKNGIPIYKKIEVKD